MKPTASTRIVWAILKKELTDAIRDYRSVLSAAVMPILGPLFITVALSRVVETTSEVRTTTLPVVGAERAPSLVAYLEAHGIDAVAAGPEVEAGIADGSVAALLEVEEDFAADFREGNRATLELRYDSSKRAHAQAVNRVKQVISAYENQTATLRLLARGVSPELKDPIWLDDVDLATPETRAAAFVDMIVMFLVLSSFIGNMYVAIDTTAGERERGSLEPLVTTQAPRSLLVVGKWLAAIVFGAVGLAVTLLLIVVLLGRVETELLGVRIAFSAKVVLQILAVMLPLTLFAASLQLCVATFAKSFKEAQTYLTLTLFMPMVPGVVMSLDPVVPDRWMFWVPMLSQQLSVGALLKAEVVPMLDLLGGVATTLGLAGLMLYLTSWLFHRETLLFR